MSDASDRVPEGTTRDAPPLNASDEKQAREIVDGYRESERWGNVVTWYGQVPVAVRLMGIMLADITALRAELATTRAQRDRLTTPWPDSVRAAMLGAYETRYEELSDDPFEDAEGGMSFSEKSSRSLASSLAVFRWWALSGEVKHWKDARDLVFSAARPDGTTEGV